MKTPGFTAEASLYKTSRHYYVVGTLDANKCSGEVLPQLPIDIDIIFKTIYLLTGIYCSQECYPTTVCDPDTGECDNRNLCYIECEGPESA